LRIVKELYRALFCVAVKHWSVTLRPGKMRFTNWNTWQLTKEEHKEKCLLNKFFDSSTSVLNEWKTAETWCGTFWDPDESVFVHVI